MVRLPNEYPAWRWRHRQVAAVEPLLRRIAAERLILLSSGGSDWIGGSGSARRVEGGHRVTARKVFTSGAPPIPSRRKPLVPSSAARSRLAEKPAVVPKMT